MIFSLCNGGTLRLTVAHLCTIYRVTSWFAQGVFADVGSMAVETKFLPALYQAEVVLEINRPIMAESWLKLMCVVYFLARLGGRMTIFTALHSQWATATALPDGDPADQEHCSRARFGGQCLNVLCFGMPCFESRRKSGTFLPMANRSSYNEIQFDKLRGCNDRLDGCREVHELKDCGHLWTVEIVSRLEIFLDSLWYED